MESKQPLDLPSIPEKNELPLTAISVVGDEIIMDLGKPVRIVKFTLPIARQFILQVRKAANILERQQQQKDKANGRGIRTVRRRTTR